MITTNMLIGWYLGGVIVTWMSALVYILVNKGCKEMQLVWAYIGLSAPVWPLTLVWGVIVSFKEK